MFYDKFQKITYNDSLITDISTRINIPDAIKNDEELFFYHKLNDGDTPESIAYNYYGKTSFNWAILLMNNVIDPFNDWLLSYEELVDYTIKLYGDSGASGWEGIHHWILNDEIYYYNPGGNFSTVSNLQYEEELNEQKRTIKILYPEYITHLNKELEYLIRLNNE